MKQIIAVTLTVLLVSAVIFGGCAAPAEETPTAPEVKPIEWRCSSFVPPFDCFSVDMVEWAEQLEEKTNGRLKITFYFSESLVKLKGEWDAVASGTCDMGTPSVSGFPERFPLNRVAGILFVYMDQPQTGYTMVSLYNKYEEFKEEMLPCRLLWFNSPAPEDIFTKDRQVKTMEDFKGLKIGTTAAEAIKALSLMGAVPVTIPTTEKYHALETGVLDGVADDWNAIYLWKMYEVTKYRTDMVRMKGRGFPVVMNLESYSELPEDIRQILDEHTPLVETTLARANGHVTFQNNAIKEILAYDEEVGNPPTYVLPEAERERLYEKCSSINEEYINELEEKGLPGRAFVEDAIALAKEYVEIYGEIKPWGA